MCSSFLVEDRNTGATGKLNKKLHRQFLGTLPTKIGSRQELWHHLANWFGEVIWWSNKDWNQASGIRRIKINNNFPFPFDPTFPNTVWQFPSSANISQHYIKSN
jgi:hypothetical protein